MKSNFYVDNNKLYEEIIKYQEKLEYAEQNHLPEPMMPNYIGECLIKIANKFAYNHSFINYSFRDEMVADAIEKGIGAIKRFNGKEFTNPFAFLTQNCYFAFITRIKQEKIQQLAKANIIRELGMDAFDVQDQDLDEDFIKEYSSYLKTYENVNDKFLQKKLPKIKEPAPLEEFVNDE